LKNIYRCKKHMLNKNEELIISKLTSPYSQFETAYTKLKDVNLKFGEITHNGKKEELTPVLYYELSEDKNRNIRKRAFKKLYEGYKGIIDTNAELLSGYIKKNNALADVRKYNSALEKSLDGDDIDTKVYNTLLKSIDNNINTIHKQWDVFKKALNIKDFHLYDVSAPIVKDYDKTYSLEEAKELILSSLEVMGEEYTKIIKRAFDERWIDIYPNKNKRSGAYCTHCYETHPYVVTNYIGKLYDVSTIIHELGHAMQYYYADKENSYENANYSIFVAEVASQVNEILLNLYIINNSNDKNEKLTTYANLIRQFKGSVVRQTMFAEFEKLIHDAEKEGTALSVDYLNDSYYELNKKYYGDKVSIDEEIKYEWSRVPHFYYDFYVYQYATGYIAALKIAMDIYNRKENALDNYIKFLKLGCTIDPVASLKVAGVDLTSEKIFDEAFKEFDRELDEFNKLRSAK
ncbi:MAG: oligoendopeptidase F, partial [Bacilli bacterium]|nr:oligoendopeptidase F [Bacilli bacterium]